MVEEFKIAKTVPDAGTETPTGRKWLATERRTCQTSKGGGNGITGHMHHVEHHKEETDVRGHEEA